ncbi:MAG: lytic murein transglycosylase [Rhodobacteraceae bacterium]|nr:lytic murein transglycosylase [Paracoccaceae bacterium]MCF8513560.1 lytic murein transglycosylase [Paracoccaceae bacterium]MCF8517540.1 lytic murein transglycosylase [Paracoccaceae bacterium]
MRVFLVLAMILALAQNVSAQSLNTSEGDALPQGDDWVDQGSQAGLEAWLTGFRDRALAAGVTAQTLDQALRDLRFDADLIKKDRNQSEFTKTIWDYLDTAVSDDRVVPGVKALKRHADLFARIEAEYGVEREVVAAIWGLESAYGTFRGKVATINALSTLSYDARRAAFFEGQLIAALKIIQNGDVTPAAMQGSWAGAMGHTQFMPGSWWEFAVDFDGDGKRNIWGDDPADALASTANYLRHWGWTKGQPWGLEISLPTGFDYDQTTERVRKPVADWAALGVRPMAGGELPDGGLASVLLPGGARGAAFLIFSNFQVIERYNTADAYVIAVGHLSDRLRGGPPIKAGWPRELRALTQDERKELQTRLTQAGFDAKGVDGRIGPNTIAAVKAWQKANGRIPDGYASLEVLEALR